jgi:hypothetical protein
MTTSPRERPARMMRNGRIEDQEFGAGELMYRRYIQEDFDGESLKPARFSFPPSLNRQRYSEPDDVVFSETGEFDEHGVLECAVERLSVQVQDHQFIPVHRPEENNYSHSEMWVEHVQTKARIEEPSRAIRKIYRTKVSQLFKIRIKAQK